MRYALTSTEPVKEQADCLIVGVFQNKKLSRVAEQLDQASQGAIRNLLAKGDLAEEVGRSLLLYSMPGVSSSRILFVYCGEEGKLKPSDFRKLSGCVASVVKSAKWDRVVNYLTDLEVKGLDAYTKVRQKYRTNRRLFLYL